MKQAGKTIVLVEQNVRFGLRLSTHGVVMESGRVLLVGGAAEVLANPEMADLFFGGSARADAKRGHERRSARRGPDEELTAAVTGPALAAAAGLGFGVFQTLNRRAVGGMSDAYLATFVQLATALGVLIVATLTTEDLGLLGDATAVSLVCFAVAGLIHFAVGWTFLNMSQMRIGAARTSPLLATTPVFGAVIAILVLNEVPAAVVWVGVALVTAGALVVSLERRLRGGLGHLLARRASGARHRARLGDEPASDQGGPRGPALAAARPDARDGRGPARLRGRAAAATVGFRARRSARGSRWPSSSSPA